MRHYLSAFATTCFQHGLGWWLSLFFAYVFGIGWYADYPKIRAGFMNWAILPTLPQEVPLWWLVLPFLIWTIAAFAHREAMRQLYAGRIIFDGPILLYDVPLYREGVPVAAIDIAYVNVRNIPYDSTNGKIIEQAYGTISIHDSNWQHVKTVDYPRWTEGQKTGYEGAPSDHFPHEWNFRTLHPNGSASRMDLFLKDKAEYQAYMLRGISQLKPLWKDEEVALLPGHYKVWVKVRGTSMRAPASLWLELENPGKDSSMRIYPLPSTWKNFRQKRRLASQCH